MTSPCSGVAEVCSCSTITLPRAVDEGHALSFEAHGPKVLIKTLASKLKEGTFVTVTGVAVKALGSLQWTSATGTKMLDLTKAKVAPWKAPKEMEGRIPQSRFGSITIAGILNRLVANRVSATYRSPEDEETHGCV